MLNPFHNGSEPMSEKNWYFAVAGAQCGPVPVEQLRDMLARGELAADTLVWCDGMSNWVEGRNLPVLLAPATAPISPQAAAYSHAYPQPAYAQPGYPPEPNASGQPAMGALPLNYYTPSQPPVRYGGFWIRFVAVFVDGMILLIPNLVLTFGVQMLFYVAPWQQRNFGTGRPANLTGVLAANLIGQLLTLAVAWVYYAAMESSTRQATLGKQACGLYVTDTNLGRLSFGQAGLRSAMRHIGSCVSIMAVAVILVAGPDSKSLMLSTAGSSVAFLIMVVGYCMAAFTERKRALHDMIASTLVVYR
ncbi:MAG: RDD family protein [Tepidisphaeraceae bacterium]